MHWTLKEVAERKGLTGYQIAQMTGISKQTIYKIMRQPYFEVLSMKTLALLCHHLDVDAGDLLARDQPAKKKRRSEPSPKRR